MSNIKHFIIFIILILSFLNCFAQINNIQYSKEAHLWVEKKFSKLSEKEKIGQLMTIRCYSNKDEKYYNNIIKQIKEYNIGGICFFQGDAISQALLTNQLQNAAKIPLIISMDAEWGLQMRLKDDCMSFPKQMTLGAIQNDSLIYEMGTAIAKQLKRIGVSMNYAPVVDINNNPNNPVINYRSFGEDKYNVARKGVMYMKGLQDNGIAAVAKHFPGHGDTDMDSHLNLPIINKTKMCMDSIELYPFKQLIDNGITGIMIAHIYFPEIDSTSNLPSSLSKSIITDILRNELNFNGLTITDGLEMKAVQNYAKPGEIEAISINAGNNIQLLPININKAIDTVYSWVKKNKIPQKTIDDACKKILYTKYILGGRSLKKNKIDTTNLLSEINSSKDKVLRRKLYQNAITVVKNENNILPLDLNSNIKTACVIISKNPLPQFENSYLKYNNADFYYIKTDDNDTKCNDIISYMADYQRIIVVVATNSNNINKKFDLNESVYNCINTLSNNLNSALCIIANPYLASNIKLINNYCTILFGYELADDVLDLVPQALFGAFKINGRLPVSINKFFKVNDGIDIYNNQVLYYSSEDEINYYYDSFDKITDIINEGITSKAFPGCEVFVAHKGNVIFNKAYGSMDYNKDNPVSTKTIYDLASITKIAATTISIMQLSDDKLFNVDLPLSVYIPELQSTNKAKIVTRNIMAHQALLNPYIPFYKDFYNNEILKNNYLSDTASKVFSLHVAKNLYTNKDFKSHIFDSIANSNLLSKNRLRRHHFVYSDLGFILLAKAIENIAHTPFEEYVEDNFYEPMGLYKTMFCPLKKYSIDEIAPTENDTSFRKQIVQGFVHDQTAALLGGVSGHAGLFSTAEQLGTLMQMLLQNGVYGNKTYLSQNIIKSFTSTQFPDDKNRRGCGFDKPDINNKNGGPVCEQASQTSFGHSGFTGCLTWIDPEYKLIYVFLSNRIYPDTSNNMINELSIRSKIFEVVYNIITNKDKDIKQ